MTRAAGNTEFLQGENLAGSSPTSVTSAKPRACTSLGSERLPAERKAFPAVFDFAGGG